LEIVIFGSPELKHCRNPSTLASILSGAPNVFRVPDGA
jgi:hypothetical protein